MSHIDQSFANRNISGGAHSASNLKPSQPPLRPNSIKPPEPGDTVQISGAKPPSLQTYVQHSFRPGMSPEMLRVQHEKGTFTDKMVHQLLKGPVFSEEAKNSSDLENVQATIEKLQLGHPEGY